MEKVKIDLNIDVKSIRKKVIDKYRDDKLFIEIYQSLKNDTNDILNIIDIYESKKTCVNCPGLDSCAQTIKGHHLWLVNEDLVTYTCHFQQEKEKRDSKYNNLVFSNLEINKNLPSLNEIDSTNSRVEIIKHISLLGDKKTKQGMYLYGPPGVGKTFIIETLLDYYLKNNARCAYVILNELFVEMKKCYFSYESSDKDHFSALLHRLKKVDVLIIDDIGAENVDAISRDDILFPILDFRMKNQKLTFFTSNYSFNDLEQHFQETSAKISEPIKAKRLMERIRVLAKEYPLNESKSRR